MYNPLMKYITALPDIEMNEFHGRNLINPNIISIHKERVFYNKESEKHRLRNAK